MVITVRCTCCEYKGETASTMQPFCPFCGSPLIAVKATEKRTRRKKS